MKGTNTGVVATTTPVVKRPVHHRFSKKREKGTSFFDLLKKRPTFPYYQCRT